VQSPPHDGPTVRPGTTPSPAGGANSASAVRTSAGPVASSEWSAPLATPPVPGELALGLCPWTAEQLAELRVLAELEAQCLARRAVLLSGMAKAVDLPEAGWTGPAPFGSLLIDVAGALAVHQNTVRAWVGDAQQLTGKLPGLLAALGEGRVSVPHAKAVMTALANAPADVSRDVEAEVLPRLLTDLDGDGAVATLLPSKAGQLASAVLLRLDPEAAVRNQKVAADERKVRVTPLPDGMIEVRATADAVAGTRLAVGLDALEDRSRLDQADALGVGLSELGRRVHRRVDLLTDLPDVCDELLDLLEGTFPALGDPSLVERWFPSVHARVTAALAAGRADAPGPVGDRPVDNRPAGDAGTGRDSGGRRGGRDARVGGKVGGKAGGKVAKVRRRRRSRRVQVRVDVPVLTCQRRSDAPGWLHGYGPISAEQALALVPTSEVRRALVDPDSGRLLALDPRGQAPSLEQALAEAASALKRERTDERAWLRDELAREHTWDGRTERRAQAREPLTPDQQQTLDDTMRLLIGWQRRETARLADPAADPARDPDAPPRAGDRRTRGPDDLAGLSDSERAVLAMALADRPLPPEDPARVVEPQHDPNAALAELVAQRDEGCDGPGCTVHAEKCDLDHHHRYDPRPATPAATGRPDGTGTPAATVRPDGPDATGPGTPTVGSSLMARSERCHQAKHHPTWTVVSHGDGSSTWTSPTGGRYTTWRYVKGLAFGPPTAQLDTHPRPEVTVEPDPSQSDDTTPLIDPAPPTEDSSPAAPAVASAAVGSAATELPDDSADPWW
jgi:hypothetical protein